jgi:hypothetical protein
MQNDKTKAGQVAGSVIDFHRFEIFPVHTRFEHVTFFVTDPSELDEFGTAKVVGQHETRTQAMAHVERIVKARRVAA